MRRQIHLDSGLVGRFAPYVPFTMRRALGLAAVVCGEARGACFVRIHFLTKAQGESTSFCFQVLASKFQAKIKTSGGLLAFVLFLDGGSLLKSTTE